MKLYRFVRFLSAGLIGASILISCGGGSAPGNETSVVSRGVVTGFGSVYVNGTKFNTENARIIVDDRAASESDLRVGMVVTVRGMRSGNGDEGVADSLIYDNELKGPVSSVSVNLLDPTEKMLVILGQSILVNSDTTIDDDGGLSYDSIALNDVLEVSGYTTDSGIIATHIELQDNDQEIEIRGYISALTADSFEINGFPVSYDNTTQLDDIDNLADGLFVEVEGRLNAGASILIAEKIEGEDEGLEDEMDEVEIKGVIHSYNDIDKTFILLGQKVDASQAVLIPSNLVLADGLIVEAEGEIVGDILRAHKVKQKGKKIKIQASLAAVDDDSISFDFNSGIIQVRVNRQTEIKDDISGMDISLGELVVGDFVEMKAFSDGAGAINAIELERVIPDDIFIVAPLDGFNGGTASVDMLGVNFDLSAATFEDANDVMLSSDDFFAALNPGVFVIIRDADQNGIFEKAELSD